MLRCGFTACVLLLVVVLLVGCKGFGADSESEIEDLIQEVVLVQRSYVDSNPSYLYRDYARTISMDLSDREFCGYAFLFHELRLVGVEVPEVCLPFQVLRYFEGPIDQQVYRTVFGMELDNYSRLDSYSLLLTYAFDSESDAERFASEVYDLVLETYESQYIPLGPLDMPRYVAAPASMEFVGYARAIAPFIEYGDEIGVFHVVVFHVDEFVLVHKAYSAEQRIRVNY